MYVPKMNVSNYKKIMINFRCYAAMEDYIMQNTELTFPAGTQAGDRQCLGIPLIDNNRADGTRFFTVSIVSFDPLVHVVPEFSQKYVYIEDNDGKPFVPHSSSI